MQRECQYAEMIMIDLAVKKQYYTDTDKGGLIACEVFVDIMPKAVLYFTKQKYLALQMTFQFPLATTLPNKPLG